MEKVVDVAVLYHRHACGDGYEYRGHHCLEVCWYGIVLQDWELLSYLNVTRISVRCVKNVNRDGMHEFEGRLFYGGGGGCG